MPGRNQSNPKTISFYLNKEEDSIEGEWSKETADEETRLKGEEGKVGCCKEDEVDV